MKTFPTLVDFFLSRPEIILEKSYFHITQMIKYQCGIEKSKTLSRLHAARAYHLIRLHDDVDYAANVHCSPQQKEILLKRFEKIFENWNSFEPEKPHGWLKFECLTNDAHFMLLDAFEIVPKRSRIKDAKTLFDAMVVLAKEHHSK